MKPNEMLKTDLHVHTDHSKDSRTSPRGVVNRALELGFDVIAVTDHNTVSGAIEAERAARGKPLLVIPGQEVRCQEGEVIVLGLRKTLPNKAPCLDILEQAGKAGGFVIVPHPFDLMRKGLGSSLLPFLGMIDAVEVFNSRTIFGSFNRKALAFAQDHSLPMTVGSDTHFPEEMGHSYMLIDARRDILSIFESILAGRTRLVMKGQTLPLRIKRGILKVRTYF